MKSLQGNVYTNISYIQYKINKFNSAFLYMQQLQNLGCRYDFIKSISMVQRSIQLEENVEVS